MLEIAAGVVLGGLTLAFLLRTRLGWYLLVGVPIGVVIGGSWGALLYFGLGDQVADSTTPELWLLSVPLAVILGGAWGARFLVHWRELSLEIAEGLDRRHGWGGVQFCAEQAAEEVMVAVTYLLFVLGFIVGPLAWRYARTPLSGWGKVWTLISFGFVFLLLGSWIYGQFETIRRKPLRSEESEGECRGDHSPGV